MKNKNIAFSGLIAAILLSVGGGTANAATQIASKDYVDKHVEGVVDTRLSDYTMTNDLGTVINQNIQTSLNTTGGVINSAMAGKADSDDLDALELRVDGNEQSIGTINNKIGEGNLGTVAQTIVGAINELKDTIPADTDFVEINTKLSAVETALQGTQAKLDENQQAAVDSGITSALVAQISSNTAKFDNTIPKPDDNCVAESGRCVLTVNTAGTGLMWMPITKDTAE